jgi:hypothetical protein
MRSIGLVLVGLVLIFGASTAVSAQCDPATQSHIRCGYYNEGYQDGARDAQARLSDDHRRYRNKFERQYENYYRDGYRAGYSSQSVYGRWTTFQRMAYDNGYNQGTSDRMAGRANSPRPSATSATADVRSYFLQGYLDAFSGLARRYDFPLEGSTPFPGPVIPGYPGPGASGSVTWNGRVDDRVRVYVQGNRIWAQDLTNSGLQQGAIQWKGSMPRRATAVTVNKRDGRGTAYVVEQPNASNGFTAAIEVYDTRGGSDNYRLEISWQGSSVTSPIYSSGRATWRGNVDDRVNIMVSGNEIWEETISGIPSLGATFDIQGYLAANQGSIRVSKRTGRGSVQVLQQPSAANGFVGVIQIYDPSGGPDRYEIDINW